MQHLGANLSKEVGKLHDWEGSIFSHRYHHIPVSDEEEAQIARLKYILGQGCKEGLVMHPADWPGVQSVKAISHGRRLIGQWINRTEMYKDSPKHKAPNASTYAEKMEVKIEPIPCWAHLADQEAKQRAKDLVWEVETETWAMHQQKGTIPATRKSILKQNPHHRAKRLNKSSKPRFHTFRRRVRGTLEKAYAEFIAAYRSEAEKLKRGLMPVCFPDNCFPSRLPFIPPAVLARQG